MDKIEFDVETACRCQQAGILEEWIHAYLNSGEWKNPSLSQGLRLQKRWWRGPLQVSLDALQRACGPEEDMEYRVSLAAWQERTQRLAQGFEDVLSIPPLIIEYRSGVLSIRDGNHRHEAMRLKGWQTCWILIWYNNQADYVAHGD